MGELKQQAAVHDIQRGRAGMTSDSDLHMEIETPGEDEERGALEKSFSRRALIRAGWAVPVALAVTPSVAFAASGGGGHTDVAAHVDAGTVTAHVDTP